MTILWLLLGIALGVLTLWVGFAVSVGVAIYYLDSKL